MSVDILETSCGQCRSMVQYSPRKPEGSLGRTAQDGHLDSHKAPQLWLLDAVWISTKYQTIARRHWTDSKRNRLWVLTVLHFYNHIAFFFFFLKLYSWQEYSLSLSLSLFSSGYAAGSVWPLRTLVTRPPFRQTGLTALSWHFRDARVTGRYWIACHGGLGVTKNTTDIKAYMFTPSRDSAILQFSFSLANDSVHAHCAA